jgi:hypothetical protein
MTSDLQKVNEIEYIYSHSFTTKKEQSLIRPTSKNLHLTVSILIVIPIALAYGLYPQRILPLLFDFKVDGINLANIFRTIMGLYLGMSVIWIMGIIKSKLWITATITNIAFMGGLMLGRLISLALDGVPSIYFVIGFVLEAVLAIWGVKNLKKYGTGNVPPI